ncbi:hypothetical protein ABIA33_005823 [Streptacidiphilus sp. MAP12-16]|jgi:hypothetical protein
MSEHAGAHRRFDEAAEQRLARRREPGLRRGIQAGGDQGII